MEMISDAFKGTYNGWARWFPFWAQKGNQFKRYYSNQFWSKKHVEGMCEYLHELLYLFFIVLFKFVCFPRNYDS